MPKWYDITRSEDYQALPPEDRAEMKQRFFQKRILPGLQADEELNNKEAVQFAFENFMQQPDDTGQNIVTSTLGSAARGFGEVVPGAIEGVGALTGIEEIRGAGQAVRGGLEYLAPTNPIYEEGNIAKVAGVGGQIGSLVATAGVGGLASKALSGAKIAAGATAAEQAALASQAINRGAKAASYLSSGLQGAAGGANEAERYGLEGPEAYLRTLAGAATELGSEALPFGTLTETATARRLLGEALPNAPGIRRSALTEGAEEVAAQVGGNLSTQLLAPLGTETPDLLEGAGEAAALGAVGGGMFGALNRLTTPRTPTVATPPPVQPVQDVAANVAAADEGRPDVAAAPNVGTPVTLDGVNYTVTIPPGSGVSPDAVAGFYDDPDTLRSLHDRGDIRLEQVITPTETVDTTDLNNNVAASAPFVPQVAKTMREIAVEDAAAPPAQVAAGDVAAVAPDPFPTQSEQWLRDRWQRLDDTRMRLIENGMLGQAAAIEDEQKRVERSLLARSPQPAVTTAQKTPVTPAESDGGSLGAFGRAAGGSSPDVTAAMVPQPEPVSSAEIAPAADPFAAAEEPVVEGQVEHSPSWGDRIRGAGTGSTLQLIDGSVATGTVLGPPINGFFDMSDGSQIDVSFVAAFKPKGGGTFKKVIKKAPPSTGLVEVSDSERGGTWYVPQKQWEAGSEVVDQVDYSNPTMSRSIRPRAKLQALKQPAPPTPNEATAPLPETITETPTTEGAAADPFAAAEEPVVATFQTAKGSTYEMFPDGTTVRNKAARPEHPGEAGVQPRSSKTLFVTEEGADALGIVQTEGVQFEIRQRNDGSWGAVATDGPGKGKFYGTSLTRASESPAVGLIPVEIWNRPGKKQAVHFGNKITAASTTPAPITPNEATAPPPETITETPTAEGAAAAPTARSGGGPQLASVQSFVETPDKKWDWEVTDQIGGTAYGRLDKGVADIIGMESVPQGKKYSEEGDRLKRRGFFRTLVNTLKSKGARKLKISMQSADTRKALARLVETGELTNPREMAGISVDEHPTLFDIPAPIEAKPKKASRPKAVQPAAVVEPAEKPATEAPPTPLAGPLRPKFVAGETVSFKLNGQPVMGTIQRVSGSGSATITYNWNGKKDQEIVMLTKELSRPVLDERISEPKAIALATNASPVTDADIDRSLSEEDKRVATAELGGRSWEEVRESFKKTFADFLNGASGASKKLLQIFRKLASTMKSIAVTSAFFFTSSNSSYVQSFGVKEVAEISNLRAPFAPNLARPEIRLPRGLPTIGAEILNTPDVIAGTGRMPAPVVDASALRPKADFGGQKVSSAVREIADFVAGTSNNEGYPFVVADKKGGLMYVFDGKGKLVKKLPALFGKDIGDFADLSADMEAGNRVTPSGRFFANPSADPEYGFTLDFVEGDQWNIAIHKLYLGDPSEQRMARIGSQTPLDNRISYGCINLDETAMAEVIEPLFAEGGGFVYVLPETQKGAESFNEQITSPDIRFSATDTPSPAQPTFTPDEARAILTKRFGKAVADKFNVEVMAPRRMGNREVEVDAELRGGTISLNLKFMDSEELLIQKAEHEMAHAVYTDKGVQEAWRELSASMPQEVRARITERMVEAGYDARVLNEEVLVRFLEEVRASTSPSKWKAFMDAVIDAFRRFFGAMPDERTARLAAARIIAAGEAAVARGLDPAKQAFGQSVSDLLGKMDAEYMAAVEAGDMEKAQRMVDKAAKKAGYLVDRPVYHGTASEFTEFRPSDTGRYGARIYTTTDEEVARQYAYSRARLSGGTPRVIKLYADKYAPKTGDIVTSSRSSDFKSADPVTYHPEGHPKAGKPIALSERFGPSPDIRFSVAGPRKVATQRDYAFQRNLSGEAATMRNLDVVRPWKETVSLAREIIDPYKKEDTSKDKMAGREKALRRLMTDTAIDPNVRSAGFMLIALETDMLASVAKNPEDQARYDDFVDIPATAYGVLESSSDPASLRLDSVTELMRMGTEAGRILNTFKLLAAMSPDGFIRKQERVRQKKVDAATEQQFGTQNVMGEIEKLWRMMQEAGATDRGLAIAAALRAFMPSRKNAARLIDQLFPQAGIRDRMTKGGEGLVRDFFQMIAGPRDPKGPLAEFDESIQSALSSMLRKVMEARGLVADNQTVQATDIDKLVRSVSADPLRFDKIAAADAAMQDELAKIEDAERRATLQQAWEEATSKMYTNVANDATLRRAVNAELKAAGVKWNEMFDKGQKPAALRAKVVDAVMQKVGALVTDATDATVKANLDMLRSEVGAAFNFIAETKRVQWLAYRAGIEARRRVAERRGDMLAALRNRGVAESALMRLAEKMAGPQRPGAEPNPVSTLIGEHLKEPVEGFTDKLVALGVDQATADALDAISGTVRADLAKRAEANSIDSAIRRLAEKLAGPPRPGRPANAVADLVNKQVREPMEDFSEKLAALGATQTDIDLLVSLTDRVRRDNLERNLFNSLKPKTKAAKSAIPRLLRVLLEAGKTGAFDSKAFNDALGEAFDLPPMTADQQKEISRLVSEINKLPQGAARVDKQQELMNYMALVQGIPARDMLLSALYANWLSGISTQLVGLTGNSANLGLRSLFIAMTNHPEDVKAYFSGLFGIGKDAGIQEAKATMQSLGSVKDWIKGKPGRTRAQFRVGQLDSPEMADALEVLLRKGPATPAEWVAYIASAGTRLRAVFRLMSAIDGMFWNSAREGMYHLAASRAARMMAKEKGMSKEEANAEFIRQLGGGPEAFEAALKDADAALKKAGQPADMLTMTRMAYDAINRARIKANPEAVSEAERFGFRVVLQQEPEGIGRFISYLIKGFQKILTPLGFPLGQMLVPFNKIVSNLFEQSIDYTGLGLVRGILGMHITDARIDWDGKSLPGVSPREGATVFSDIEARERKMAGFLGLTLSAAAYFAAKANMDDDDDEAPFMIYAFGPVDKNKRNQMPDGWEPFSIKIGNKYYRYAEWPLGMVLAGFGAALDAERYGNMKEKDTLERIGYSAMLGLKGFMTQGVLSNVDNAVDVLVFKATGKKYTDIPANAAKGLIPAQGLLRDISRVFDNTKISNDDIASALLRDIPVVKSWGFRPELNVFGEPVMQDGHAVISRFVTERRPHTEADYLTRNKLYIPGMDETVTIGQYLPPAERDRFKRRAMQMQAMENGVFTAEQNYDFRKRAGELTKAAVQRIMKQAPAVRTDEQRKAVQNLIDKQVGLARRRAMVEAVPYQPPPAQ